MKTVNIHEAKTHLSKLIDSAVKGDPFIIAKAGKPMVKVTAYAEVPINPMRRIGFLKANMMVLAYSRKSLELSVGYAFADLERYSKL